jgi:cell fate (sporulation/competence/biofilm development) regulator YmcA (YheA/YmcA/DUF963 family)
MSLLQILQWIFLFMMVAGWIAASERERRYRKRLEELDAKADPLKKILEEIREKHTALLKAAARINEVTNELERLRPLMTQFYKHLENFNKMY